MRPVHHIRQIGTAATLCGLMLLILLVLATLRLLPEWWSNPDLSHGLFTPVLFVVLLHESRTRGTRRWLPAIAARALAATAALAGIALLVTGSLYAIALDWTHPLAGYLTGLALSAGLVAALALASAADRRWQPWNWSAFVAIGLWVLSLPLPPGTAARLTLQLQLWVSDGVLTSLHWLGIAATRTGNIIDLGNTSVGVEEACSGIRSLLSCVYAAAFFSAALVTRALNRCVILLLAPVLAIVMNFVRSLLLTLLAHRGVDISGTWHDATGFAILVLTAAALGGTALVLGRREQRGTQPDRASISTVNTNTGTHDLQWLTGAYGFALAWILTLALLSRPAPAMTEPPDLAAMLPAETETWNQVATDNLYAYAPALQTNHLVQRTYVRREPDDSRTQLTVYLAYWSPGQAPVSVVASHTPDLCWPGAGWTPAPEAAGVQRLEIERGRTLNPAQYRYFTHRSLPQHVWFWHVYEDRVIHSPDALSPIEVLRSVFRFGIRSRGQQLFVRVSSNRPWEVIHDDPLIRSLFQQLEAFGI